MLAFCKTYKTTLALQLLWAGLYLAGLFFPLNDLLCGRGLALLSGEWYRILCAPHLHYGVLHLLVNLLGLYFAGTLLEPRMGSARFAAFSLLAASAASAVYALVTPRSTDYMGGSILVFALLGLWLARRLLYRDAPPLRLGSWRGNFLLGYALLGNVPVLPFMDGGTLALHAVSFAVGALLGAVPFFYKRKAPSPPTTL